MSGLFVVDASILAQYLVVEEYTPHVRVLFSESLRGTQLISPEIAVVECTNVLWKYTQFHGMPSELARYLVKDLVALPVVTQPALEFLPRALALGLAHGLPIYDSLYIALAERLDCPLITLDTRQARAAEAGGIALKAITDFAPST